MTKIIKVSSTLTNRILPNRKLNKSIEKPFDKLTKTTPRARPDDSITATAESGGIFVDCLSLVIANAARIETMKAVHIG
jgi:hypothetical protein